MSHMPIIIAASLLASVGLATSASAAHTMKNNAGDEAAIRSVMADYNAALNGGKTAAVLPLYADDGVFMPPYSQSAIGKEGVRKAYDAVFAELKFDVKFTIADPCLR